MNLHKIKDPVEGDVLAVEGGASAAPTKCSYMYYEYSRKGG